MYPEQNKLGYCCSKEETKVRIEKYLFFRLKLKDFEEKLNAAHGRFSSLQIQNPKLHPRAPRQSRAGIACLWLFNLLCRESRVSPAHPWFLFDSFYAKSHCAWSGLDTLFSTSRSQLSNAVGGVLLDTLALCTQIPTVRGVQREIYFKNNVIN